jgi:hypothetical protein
VAERRTQRDESPVVGEQVEANVAATGAPVRSGNRALLWKRRRRRRAEAHRVLLDGEERLRHRGRVSPGSSGGGRVSSPRASGGRESPLVNRSGSCSMGTQQVRREGKIKRTKRYILLRGRLCNFCLSLT